MKSLFKYPLSLSLEKYLLLPSSFFIVCSVLILPFIISVIYFFFEFTELNDLNRRLFSLQKKLESKESQMKNEEKILHQIKTSHVGYLEEVLGSLVFLGTERQKWQLFSEQLEPSYPMKERVSFLEHGNNTLQFTQTDLRKNKFFQETEENQKNAIEISEEDLKTLLCYIEGLQIHPYSPKKRAPQILIKTFELEKKTILGIADKTYHIQMQLIKREASLKL